MNNKEMLETKCRKCIRIGKDMCDTCTLTETEYIYVDELVAADILAEEAEEDRKKKEKMAKVRSALKNSKQPKLITTDVIEKMRYKLDAKLEQEVNNIMQNTDAFAIYSFHLNKDYNDDPKQFEFSNDIFDVYTNKKGSFAMVDHNNGLWTLVNTNRAVIKAETSFIIDKSGRAIAPRISIMPEIKNHRKLALLAVGHILGKGI